MKVTVILMRIYVARLTAYCQRNEGPKHWQPKFEVFFPTLTVGTQL